MGGNANPKETRRLKDHLKVWNTFGSITKRKEDLLNKIQELDKVEIFGGLSRSLNLIGPEPKMNSKSLVLEKNSMA